MRPRGVAVLGSALLVWAACTPGGEGEPAEWAGFGAPVSVALAGGKRGLAAGDVTGDGRRDLLTVLTDEGRVAVLAAGADGGFTPGRSLPAPDTRPNADVQLADVDRDGHRDVLVVGHFANALTVFLGREGGEFREGQRYDLGNHAQRLRVVDLDGDGDLDVVTKNAGSAGVFNLTVLRGRGDGTFAPAEPYEVSGLPRDLAVADVTGDRVPDALVLIGNANALDVLPGRGDGTLGPRSTLPLEPGACGDVMRLAVHDANRDGVADLAVTCGVDATGALLLLTGRGDGTFAAAPQLAVEPASAVVATDVDHDGADDLALTTWSGSLLLLRGQGDGTFASPRTLASGEGWATALLAEDLDGDGFPELAWTTDTALVVLANAGMQ